MSILISCCFHALVDHRIMPNFPFYLFPISSDCWNFTTSTRPSSRHFPISAQTSFASSIVRQSEIFTDKAIPESKLSYTWVKYTFSQISAIFITKLMIWSLTKIRDLRLYGAPLRLTKVFFYMKIRLALQWCIVQSLKSNSHFDMFWRVLSVEPWKWS